MNRVRNKLLVGLFLFIDFRKAFDLVDALLLLNKLRLYGFSINAIKLIKNYFNGRKQKVKIDDIFSQLRDNLLGVPQGSILGPLFFLIFINDLPYFLKNFLSFLFADDTSLFLSNQDLDQLLLEFNKSIDYFIKWCYFNRLDINWDKTELMFFTQKRKIDFPKTIKIQDKSINVVDQFKLLGIIIDNDLTFLPQVASLRIKINQRLFSIKKIFFLDDSVKLQFFKTFILPYFDYCSTLLIYYPKSTIQKIMNSYNFCLFKLFNIKYDINTSDDFNKMNNYLEEFGLSCFQHRLIQRLMIFSYNIMNQQENQLKKQLNFNKDLNKKYNLRNKNNLSQPKIAGTNCFDEDTIEYFFYLFINTCCLDDLHLKLNLFKIRTKNNINILFTKFIKKFPKFDLNYKCLENYNYFT
jgi:ribonucleases P/MRP protein subunit RPP40